MAQQHFDSSTLEEIPSTIAVLAATSYQQAPSIPSFTDANTNRSHCKDWTRTYGRLLPFEGPPASWPRYLLVTYLCSANVCDFLILRYSDKHMTASQRLLFQVLVFFLAIDPYETITWTVIPSMWTSLYQSLGMDKARRFTMGNDLPSGGLNTDYTEYAHL